MGGDGQGYDATAKIHRQIEGVKGDGKGGGKEGGKFYRELACCCQVPLRIGKDRRLHERDVHHAPQNGAEDGQGGSPVAEADHLEGGAGEMQKEEDEDQGQG